MASPRHCLILICRNVNLAAADTTKNRKGAALLQGNYLTVRDGDRPASRDPVGGRRWGSLLLLLLVANVFVATLAWFLVGLFLR
jgi:hypothetical protein